MKLIVGLGNPGYRFANTRHNTGFKAVKLLAKKYNIKIVNRRFGTKIGTGLISSHRVILALPQKFMNCSGEPIKSLVEKEKIALSDLLIVCDDVNLTLGHLRLRAKGSAGGHKGLKSVIEHLGGGDFSRLRIGVGKQDLSGDITHFVLGRFTSREVVSLPEILSKAVQACEHWIEFKDE